ncbi:MAG: polysaccharide deacetylase family protein [Candidatus Thiodiazotropha sp.]
MSLVKRIIKSAIANALYYSGMLSFLKKNKLSNKSFVLMYHRVLPSSLMESIHSTGGIVTDVELFSRHLDWLKEEFTILSVPELINIFEQGREIPSGSCVITFDDGWWDNYEFAKPLLEKKAVPAMIFLPYDYIGNDLVFWQEELLARLLALALSEDLSQQAKLREITGLQGDLDKQSLRDYITGLKTLDYDEINAVLSELREIQSNIEVDLTNDRYLDWAQVDRMSRSVIKFGSHSLSHRMLTHIDRNEAKHEINESKRLLDEKLGGGVQAIAYPNGNSDEQIEKMAENAGYSIGFSTKPGYISKESNKMRLSRINVHTNNSVSKPIFLCHILNIF